MLQPHQLFLNGYYGGGPYRCPTYGVACAPTYIGYSDAVTYNLPFGTPIATSPTRFKRPSIYFAPNAPPHPFDGPLPLYDNSIDVAQNNVGMTKLQYTYALSQSAYLRAYGYTFYSDWFENDPTLAAADIVPSFPGDAQYMLASHTSGGALDFEDPVDPQNLLSLNRSVTAGVVGLDNLTAYIGEPPTGISLSPEGSPIGYMARTGNGYTCYDPPTGAREPCISTGYYDVALKRTFPTPTWIGGAMSGPPAWPHSFSPVGSPAAKAGATWDTLWNSNLDGPYNTVRPRFINAALQNRGSPKRQAIDQRVAPLRRLYIRSSRLGYDGYAVPVCRRVPGRPGACSGDRSVSTRGAAACPVSRRRPRRSSSTATAIRL